MNIFLSRLHLNPNNRQVASELLHPYEMHRTFMRAFPETNGNAREVFGVLFRTEMDSKKGTVTVFVQSTEEPDWSVLNKEDYFRNKNGRPGFECKDITNSLKRIRVGQVLAFRLRANPTKRIARKDDPMKGKRVEITQQEERLLWLSRKGESGGFRILPESIVVRREGKVYARKNVVPKGRVTTTHYSARFDGLLQVTDQDRFTHTLVKGIGPGKAFGFGLLSVAPIASGQ